ncbi:hypothetical protein KVT40_001239 [Elsinoe batatas]|uniref:Dipeptidyl-peptidase V n=1 Tax=Elsinoe batatas TaxID=2601811 RepID=A0A8K0PNF0_9PEZI|nr:hypothetical protein KVT40_001239 [Elsinoe batatas]
MERYEKWLDSQIPQYPRLSPDGTKVVYTTALPLGHQKDNNRVSAIWIADVGKEKSARQLTTGLFNDERPHWTPDGSSIIFTSDRKEAGKKTGLYQLSLAGGEAILLTDANYEMSIGPFEVSPNGKYIAMLRPDETAPEQKRHDEDTGEVDVWGERWEFNRLKLIHLLTRTIQTIVTGDYHTVDLVWASDSKSIIYKTQHTPELESPFTADSFIDKVDIVSKEIKLISKCQYLSWSPEPSLHIAGDRVYVVGSTKEGVSSTSQAVYSVSLRDGSWKLEIGGQDHCATQLSSSKEILVAHTMNDLHDEIRPLSGNVHFSEFCDVRGVSVAAVESSTVFAIVKTTINEPPEVYTFTIEDKTPIQVSSHASLSSEPSNIALQIHIPSTDGDVELDGVFIYPSSLSTADRPSKPLPTLIDPHGGPYSRRTNTFMPGYGWTHALLAQGYAVLQTNYRGGASHGAHFAGPYVAGTKDYDDVIALTNHMVKTGFSDPENLIIGGWSQGGFLTYLAAVRNGTHGFGWSFKGGIAGAGVTDWDTMVVTSDIPKMEAEIGGGGAPWDVDKTDVKARTGSALWEFREAAEEGRVPPMLLLHGKEDVRVPVTQAWGFQRACRQYGVKCEMATYPRAGHLVKERKQLMDMMRRVLRFCDVHFTS